MSGCKYWIKLIFFLTFIGIIKAGGHFMRLAALGAMGLCGLYLLHLLAQDYNKIRKPVQAVAKALFRFKRDANFTEGFITSTEAYDFSDNKFKDFIWHKIFQMDPSNCIKSFVCQLWAEPKNKWNQIETNIIKTIRAGIVKNKWIYNQFQDVIVIGDQEQGAIKCRKKYNSCPYTLDLMISVLKFFR